MHVRISERKTLCQIPLTCLNKGEREDEWDGIMREERACYEKRGMGGGGQGGEDWEGPMRGGVECDGCCLKIC